MESRRGGINLLRSSWNPPVPLGLPHRLMEDDFYGGYFIPKGSNVLANIQYVRSKDG